MRVSRRRQRRRRAYDLLPAQKMCTLKERYRSGADAQAVVDLMRRKVVYIGGVGPRGELQTYQCRRCDYWHIGHGRPGGYRP